VLDWGLERKKEREIVEKVLLGYDGSMEFGATRES